MLDQVHILIVDPDDHVFDMCTPAFSAQGWVVERARSFREASQLVRRSPYHVMIVDVILPDALGLDAWRHFKKIRPEAAGIIVTSSPALYHSLDAIEDGVLAFLLKPLHKEMLTSLVSQAAQQMQQAASSGQGKQDLKGLTALLSAIAETKTPREIVQVALEHLRLALQPDWSAAYLSNHGQFVWKDHIVPAPFQKGGWSQVQSRFKERWVLRAVQSRQVQIVGRGETPQASLPIPRAVGLKAVVIVPLVNRGAAFGALAMVSHKESGLDMTEVKIELINIVSLVTVLALDNARLSKRLQAGSRPSKSARRSRTKVKSA
jgi:FixJ family two-component response regulator